LSRKLAPNTSERYAAHVPAGAPLNLALLLPAAGVGRGVGAGWRPGWEIGSQPIPSRGGGHLRLLAGIRYIVGNTATTLSALLGGVAQPWWLFYVRRLPDGAPGAARC
jgi:hypothetical protein